MIVVYSVVMNGRGVLLVPVLRRRRRVREVVRQRRCRVELVARAVGRLEVAEQTRRAGRSDVAPPCAVRADAASACAGVGRKSAARVTSNARRYFQVANLDVTANKKLLFG